MPKKRFEPYRRVNVYLHGPQLEVRDQIDNYSAFVQIATDHAADIMAWAILNRANPEKYHDINKLEDVVDDFNQAFPVDPMINKKVKQWPKNSQKLLPSA